MAYVTRPVLIEGAGEGAVVENFGVGSSVHKKEKLRKLKNN
jgi:hypothetical protein